MITHLTWVLGNKMPEIDTSIVTCHARDNISIDSLIDELLDLVARRLLMMLKTSMNEWPPSWAPILHVYIDSMVYNRRRNQSNDDTLEYLVKNGRRAGVVLIMHTSFV